MNTNELTSFTLNAPNNISILIDGNHGIGKSAVTAGIAKQYCARVAEEHKQKGMSFNPDKDFRFIDIRLSQNDVGDLKGIPMEAGGFTFFAPPHWYPMHEEDEAILGERLKSAGKEFSPFNGAKYGLLFLDEFNRASREVSQVAFELVLDRRLNGWRIPDGWKIVAAINGNSDYYQIIEMDPALTDRFFMVKFNPLYEELFAWGEETRLDDEGNEIQNLHPAVLGYLKKKHDAIDPSGKEIEKATTEGSKIQSRRSWARLSSTIYKYESAFKQNKVGSYDLLDLMTKEAVQRLVLISGGFVGTTWSLDFVNYVQRDYRVLSPKEVLDKYSKEVSTYVKNAKVPELAEFTKGLIDELAKNTSKLSLKRKTNILTFMEDLPNEVAAKFWMDWSGNSSLRDQSQDWFNCDRSKRRMLQVLGNPQNTKDRIAEIDEKIAKDSNKGLWK